MSMGVLQVHSLGYSSRHGCELRFMPCTCSPGGTQCTSEWIQVWFLALRALEQVAVLLHTAQGVFWWSVGFFLVLLFDGL